MKTPAPGRRRARVSRYAGHEGGEGPVSERNAAVSGRRKTPPPSVTAPQGGGRETAYRGLSPGIGATMQGGGSIAALVFGVQGRRKNPKFRYLRGDVREEERRRRFYQGPGRRKGRDVVNLFAVSGLVGHGVDRCAGHAQIGQITVGQTGQLKHCFAVNFVASEPFCQRFEQTAERSGGGRCGTANVVCVSHVTLTLVCVQAICPE